MRSTFGKKYLVYYFFVWAIVTIAHFLIFRYAFSIETDAAIADSVIYNGIFAILGVGLAFMMRFSGISDRNLPEQLFYHLTGAAATLFIWIAVANSILINAFHFSETYIVFLKENLPMRIISGILFYVALIVTHYLLIKMQELKQQHDKEEELRNLLRETELNALRSQIRPHFLFNSLNSISSLTVSDPGKAREMVIKLAEFMRYSLNIADQPMSTIEKELYHTQLYLDIEKVRFGERLNLDMSVEENMLSHRIPSMTIQPLMENAVKYGVYESTEPVTLELAVRRSGGSAVVELINPRQDGDQPIKGTGTGLKNIRARLRNIYGRDDLLETRIMGDRFYALLKLPDHE